MFTLNCRGRLLIADNPIVMGIINATPDSFYGKSRHISTDDILRTAEQMIREGASILDVGGQSSRPGSERISADEELSRVMDPLTALTSRFPESFFSIDTFYAKVAKEAVEAGAVIVNDISAGAFDPGLWNTVAGLKVPYVLMHMKGEPATMQNNPEYESVSVEVLDFFIRKLELLKQEGIHDVIVDPGFGFGKTAPQNFRLLRDLGAFRMLNAPILIGVSRKSSIARTLGISTEESLNGTTVLNTIALMNGAAILRVHDVKAAMEAIKLYCEIHK